MVFVAVGGQASNEYHLTLYMLKGYDILNPLRLNGAIEKTLTYLELFKQEPDTMVLVDGDIENPHFSWPVFGHITFKENVR
jgi:hypothetical protein